MTGPQEIKISTSRPGLVEFEIGSSTSLAPFEDHCTILLDEFTENNPIGLAEFDETMDVITIDGLGSIDPEDEPEGPVQTEETVDEEPVDDSEKIADEVIIPAEEPPVEEEPVEPEPEPVREPANAVVGFVCRYALDVTEIADSNGRVRDYPKVHLISVPCAGMIKTSWLRRALDSGASGAFVISCTEGSCSHRRGASIASERWQKTRRPMLLSRCDRSRLRFLEGHPAGKDELIKKIRNFSAELGKLDADSRRDFGMPDADRPVEQIDLGDELM